MISLKDHGNLRIWPGSHRDGAEPADPSAPVRQIPMHVLTLMIHEAIVFRGDFVHAGGAYPDFDHIRLHCFMDPIGVRRVSDATYIYGQTTYEAFRIGMDRVIVFRF